MIREIRELAIRRWKADVEFWKAEAHAAYAGNDAEGLQKAMHGYAVAIDNQVRARTAW